MRSSYDLSTLHREMKRGQATREAGALYPLPRSGSPYDLGQVGKVEAVYKARKDYVAKNLTQR